MIALAVAPIALAACSWVHAIVVVNASDAPLEVTVSVRERDRWLASDTLYGAPLDRFAAGEVGSEDWQPLAHAAAPRSLAKSQESPADAEAVTLTVPPRTVVRIASAVNCRPDLGRCDRMSLVALELRGAHGARSLEGAALHTAFAFEHNTFALRYP